MPAITPETPVPILQTQIGLGKSMGASKQDEYNVLAIRRHIAKRYLEGKPYHEIAAELKCSTTNIVYHMKVIRDQWVKGMGEDFNARKAQELAKIDNLEEAAWQSFFKSCEDAVTTSEEVEEAIRANKNEDGTVASEEMKPINRVVKTIRKGQAGDPRFMERIAWCIDMRCKILGIAKEAPTNVNNLILNFDQLFGAPETMDDPIQRRIEEVRQLPPAEHVGQEAEIPVEPVEPQAASLPAPAPAPKKVDPLKPRKNPPAGPKFNGPVYKAPPRLNKPT